MWPLQQLICVIIIAPIRRYEAFQNDPLRASPKYILPNLI